MANSRIWQGIKSSEAASAPLDFIGVWYVTFYNSEAQSSKSLKTQERVDYGRK
jgi:hypothetical protein